MMQKFKGYGEFAGAAQPEPTPAKQEEVKMPVDDWSEVQTKK